MNVINQNKKIVFNTNNLEQFRTGRDSLRKDEILNNYATASCNRFKYKMGNNNPLKLSQGDNIKI